jgi:DNA-binding Lrp family transcriptional regulator
MSYSAAIDELDSRLILVMRENPRIGLMETSRLLGVARGTVQARLDRLTERGVITGFGPEVSPSGLGYPVLAFVSLEIAQGRLDESIAMLAAIPEVLEVHGTSGASDLVCRVAARSNAHLQQVLLKVLETPAVQRTSTSIALSTLVAHRVEPLVRAAPEPE